MKIAVATDDHLNVAGHVGRCKSFLVYQTEGVKITDKIIRINSFTHHGRHQKNEVDKHHKGEGQGHQHNHHNLIDGLKDCEVLILNHGGRRLIDDLKENNILPVLTDEKLAEDAVLKYIKGELVVNEENICKEHRN